MNPKWSKWLEPQPVIAVVIGLFSVVSFYVTFAERVSRAEMSANSVAQSLTEHKADEAQKFTRIDDKLDTLLQRVAK